MSKWTKHCSSACGSEFIRFVNMLINDTTYLLDESLEGLKRIHDIQVLVADNEAWSRLSRVLFDC